MRKLWPFLKRFAHYKWLLLGGFILSLLAAVAGIGLLSLSGWFISASAFAGVSGVALAFNYFTPAAGVRFFATLRIVARYGERVLTHDATFRLLTDLRVWFYQKLEPLAPALFLRYRSGDLLNRVMSDIESLDNLYIRIVVPTLVVLVVWLTGLWFFHFFSLPLAWVVAVLMLLAILVAPLLSHWFGRRVGQALAQTLAQLRTIWVQEAQFLTETKLFGREERVLNELEKQDHALRQWQFKMSMLAGFISALLVLLAGFTMWVAVIIAIPMVSAHHLDGANLALIALAVLGSFEIIGMVPNAYQYLGQTVRSAERILEIAHSQPEVVFPERSKNIPKDASLTLTNVSFSFHAHQTPVLDNVHLQLAAGEQMALIGPSGQGKSTLLNVVTRFLQPDHGTIELGGVDIQQLSEADLRASMTVLTQRAHLFSTTLRDNLKMAQPKVSDDQLWQVLKEVELFELVNTMPKGLDTYVGEGGRQLSGGQLKRLALARAWLHDAPVWLLDEPMEGLDNLTRQTLLTRLKEKLKGKTVIWVTHQAQDAKVLGLKEVSMGQVPFGT